MYANYEAVKPHQPFAAAQLAQIDIEQRCLARAALDFILLTVCAEQHL